MKAWIIARKDWEEVFRNRLVLASVVLTPLLFVVMAVGSFGAMRGALGPAAVAEIEKDADELRQLTGGLCAELDGVACVEAYMGTLFLLTFLMLPLILSSVFAAHSVVGEKTARTLEPLLATPVRTVELLVGKAAAAAVPAVLATWLGVAAYLVAARQLLSAAGFAVLLSPHWLVAVGLGAPLLAGFGVLCAILISSRVNDPRAAQQLSGLVVLPLVALLVGQSLGLVLVDGRVVYAGCVLLLLANALLLLVAVRVFERESILTRWT
jgi:ABC-2 type transport system permease protein